MGLRSSDETGASTPQEESARLEEIRCLREIVRGMFRALQMKSQDDSLLEYFRRHPAVQRALEYDRG